ncbi:MAG: DUF1385 domain-containing protein [Selenomonadaceae bacterium]|uniref:DUF1385 domain-containing protein n=1 Tax=Selenomonas bovis TaxID=416586 RepID=UPI0004E0B5A0|nr:DUF1385 domain-containing protein [Selenomonas bovis]MDY6272440.1 DUF1385 domain-containing protein [Selenomonadaceae bacterium]
MAKLSVGGQAVIEGVMMRGPKDVATAVRDPNGRIQVETHPVSSIADRYPILKKPMLRGTVSLVESLVLGLRSLSYSAKMAGDEDEQLTDKEMAGTIIFALVLASILFIAIPTGAAKFFHFITDDPVFLNLMEGFLRLAIFLAYIGGISRMKDIRRVFQYHGAEHKTIHCYEAGLPLTVANVQRFSRLHPRCGTNFLLIVMLVSIFVYAFLGWPSLIERIVSRILLLPVVAGISYELIRFAGRTTNPVALKLIKPGLWLQYLTTRPPQDDMVEVAIESLKAVLPAEEILPGSGHYLTEDAQAAAATEPPASDHVPALES